MSIFYGSTSDDGPAFHVPYHRQNATKRYLAHYANYLALQFIANTTKNGTEKGQALRELTIAEKKLSHWERHANFEKDVALKGVAEMKKNWSSGAR